MENKKKIIYVTSVRLPTEKAHGLATVKICEAFASRGYEVDCVIPRLWRKEEKDIFNFYNLKTNFKIFKISCVDLIPFGVFEKITFLIQSISFSIFATLFIAIKYRKETKNLVFFSHDYIPLYFMTFLPVKVFYDIHHFPGTNFMYRRVMKKAFGFAVQTRWKIKAVCEKFGVSPDTVVYWPNGTDVENFDIALSVDEARTKLGIPLDRKIVMYTGQLFLWKGVDTLIQSVKMLPRDIFIYVVGGSDKDVENFKKVVDGAIDERIVFVPFQQHSMIPLWLRAADVLVLPNTGKQKVSLYYTSPMKLFEYIAARKPVVASAIPSIMEILNEDNSILVEPDVPAALATGITLAIENKELSRRISENATIDSKKYTWGQRAQKITDYFEKYA